MIPLSYPIRLGVVKNVGRTYIDFEFIDRIDKQTFRVPIPHPYAGRGGGIFAGIEKDSIIIVSNGPSEKWYCLGVIPDHNFYFDLSGASNIKAHETPYPDIKEGEVGMKSNKGSRVFLTDDGNIHIDAAIGNSLSDIELSRDTETLFHRINNSYSFTESGRSIQGVIKRNLDKAESSTDTDTVNFLDGEGYDRLLKEIGRSPGQEVHNRTTKLIKQVIRNPPLIEKREIVYEYADSFDVKNFNDEFKKSTGSVEDALALKTKASDRSKRRSDVLNLNQRNFNHLIEKIEGTVVDIYGNILDINRNKINIPKAEEITARTPEDLKRMYDHHRRAIKLHYEINSRKDIDTDEPQDADKSKNNAKNFSRFSIDIDGEGLVKLNIPATSETGNIPVLGRYFTSRDEEDKDRGNFRDSDFIDIRLKQFGVGGINIEDSDYLPKTIDNSTATVGTAYHNLINVADSVLTGGTIARLTGNTNKSVSSNISNKISNRGGPDSGANAGGRSLSANLDGSLELSIGADTIDKKSLVIDTQGGIITHYGRDLNGRSIISQTDGDVILKIGGNGTRGDERFSDTENRPGRLEIHLNRGAGSAPQKIIIDENGLTLDIQGNMILKSSGDMALDAGGRLLLHGELCFFYGSTDVEKREILGQESLVVRSGSCQFT